MYVESELIKIANNGKPTTEYIENELINDLIFLLLNFVLQKKP